MLFLGYQFYLMIKEKKKGKIKFKLFNFFKPFIKKYLFGILILILSSLISLIFPVLVGKMIDAIKVSLFKINQLAILLIFLFITQSILSYLRIIIFVKVTEQFLAFLRKITYEKLISLPLQFYNNRRVAEINSRISTDLILLQETLTTTSAEFLRQIIIIIGGILMLAFTSIKLTIFMLSIFPVIILFAVFLGKKLKKYSKKNQNILAESNTILEETLSSIMTVKSFTNEIFEFNRYSNKIDLIMINTIKLGKLRAILASFIIIGIFGSISSIIWYGVRLIYLGDISTGNLTSFLILTVFIGASIGSLSDLYSKIQIAIGASEKLIEIINEKNEKLKQGLEKFVINGNIQINNLSFFYPNRKKNIVLDNINLNIKKGEKIALVGYSGSGKSSLIKLIMRFYDNYSGKIFIDGEDIKNINIHNLRKQIALVPQENFLFGGSIKENIRYGKLDATYEEIIDAAKKANAYEFIEKLPEGFNTNVGDRGMRLSGGQKQRISIARAILKDPKILILDEATSSLDSKSEILIQKGIDNLMKNKTSIIITHRLSTIRNVDNIFVLNNGTIYESGNHSELQNINNGLYKKLSELQFKNT